MALFGLLIFNAKKTNLTEPNQFDLNQVLVSSESYSREISFPDLIRFFAHTRLNQTVNTPYNNKQKQQTRNKDLVYTNINSSTNLQKHFMI